MFSHKTSGISAKTISYLQSTLETFLEHSSSLAIDSRKVTPGSIFCAYPGTMVDGRDFIQTAIKVGAQVVLWESGTEPKINIPNFPVNNLIQYVGILAAIKAKYPSRSSLNIAITGTNGKTSISHWLNQAYHYLAQKTAIIGTTGAGIYPDISDYAATTPDPITLQNLLTSFKEQNVEVLAMEVSSHALEQGRVNGIEFSCAVFTNLTQDHLDYHKTMEAYYLAKEKLFYWDGLKSAVINSDDSYGQRLIKNLNHDNPQLAVFSYGINSGDVQARQIKLSHQGLSFDLCYQGKTQPIQAQVIGRFNVYNLLAMFATLLANGVSWEMLPDIAANLKPVAGRMDMQICLGRPLVVVDFAHSPDALAKALATLAEIKGNGRLFCVFGCGGNRDKAKRPLMGEAVANYADVIIVTTDNPRFEDASKIIDDIIPGLQNANYQIIIDRLSAIQTAFKQALPEDIILIAGKGHEEYQEVNGVKHHFSDLEIVAGLLK